MPGVELWDYRRNAMLYDRDHPIVGHPPCGPWSSLKLMNKVQSPLCAPLAVEIVRRCGGVLEHPAGSGLWKHSGLPAVGAPPDRFGGRTVQVNQCEWGHVARKKTWLYLVGVPEESITSPPFPDRKPTHWVNGGRNPNRKGSGGLVPKGIKLCSAQQRRRTPKAFAEWLVSLARASTR